MNVSKMKIKPKNLVGKLIDTHTHCGGMDLSNFYKGRYPSNQDILDLEKKRQEANIGYQIVFPMPTSIYYDIATYWKKHIFIPSGYSEYPFQLENRYLFSQIEHFNLNCMLPFAAISLQDKVLQQEKNIIYLSETYPLYGLKYHTKVDQKSADKLDVESGFIDIARELNIPIIFHTELKGCSDAINVLKLASRHPDIRFCAAHLGGLSVDFCRELDSYPYNNIFLDSCPLLPKCASINKKNSDGLLDLNYNEPVSVLQHFVERYPNRMLWGTDCPWTEYCLLEESRQNNSMEFGYLREVKIIQESDFKQIMTKNTIRYLFGEDC